MEQKKTAAGFIHLHVHTEYSLLDGMSKIPELVKKVKDSGMTACAITDHGVAYGLVEFYNECKKQGIKPILGCEFYEAPKSRFDKKSRDDKYSHLILLVKNQKGYENLCHLVSKSNTEGFYYKPRIDFELLEQYHEGLICLSACLAGSVPKSIVRQDMLETEALILRYKELFGDDYYLEIQNHGIPDEMLVAQTLVQMSKKFGIKLVCTNDSHYVDSEDAEAHEWLLCLQTQKRIDDPDRMVYEGDYSLKTEEEMRALFPAIPEAFDNTLEVADKCNFDFVFGEYRMPRVDIPEEYGKDYFKYLSDEAYKGLDARYPVGHIERPQAIKDLEYELSVIKQMGFAEYFLDTRKTIKWAREHNIIVGPGRGSAVGSRMCYCLGITDLDPIPYSLLFERFLNPERISMPDIDVDYDFSHKDEVIAFEAGSNGLDRFAKIQTFMGMLAKGVLRDVARVGGFPVSVGNKLASLIPNEKDITLSKAWELNQELRDYVQNEPGVEKLWNIALKLEGTKKSPSTHACGHIPTPVPCEDLFPVSVDSETGYLICQYNMADAEHLGNLKKDLLMLRNLTIIDVAQKAVRERYGVDVPLWTNEILNDPQALALIAAGDTNGVFQLESEGMKNFMRDLKPNCFEDIIAGVALYRPGPMDFIPDYIRGKKDPSGITYLVPELEPILAPTYGCIVYQEQVMQIVQKLAGFTMGRADVVRKAMGKKKQDIMDQEKTHFIYGSEELNIPGCIKKGIPEETAITIWGQMNDFAKYAFNKSHAAAYAAIAMQTAYLKAHYPLEFASGLFSSVMDQPKKLAIYINEYIRKGFKVLPPDINVSGVVFTVKADAVCYGLTSIKNVGRDAVQKIMDERDRNGLYEGLDDFLKRNLDINSQMLTSLICAGALDFTGYTRRSLKEHAGRILDGYKKEKQSQIDGQMSLFDMDFMDQDDYNTIPQLPEYEDRELLRMEKEATGFYISGHPLDSFESYLAKQGTLSSADLSYDEETQSCPVVGGDLVHTAGLITAVRSIYTKKGDPMAFVTLEDRYGTINVIVFPRQYEKMHPLLNEDALVAVNGTVSIDDKGISIIAESMVNLDMLPNDLWLCFNSMEDYNRYGRQGINSLKTRYPGDESSIAIYIRNPRLKKVEPDCVKLTESCISEAYQMFGTENVALLPVSL